MERSPRQTYSPFWRAAALGMIGLAAAATTPEIGVADYIPLPESSSHLTKEQKRVNGLAQQTATRLGNMSIDRDSPVKTHVVLSKDKKARELTRRLEINPNSTRYGGAEYSLTTTFPLINGKIDRSHPSYVQLSAGNSSYTIQNSDESNLWFIQGTLINEKTNKTTNFGAAVKPRAEIQGPVLFPKVLSDTDLDQFSTAVQSIFHQAEQGQMPRQNYPVPIDRSAIIDPNALN